MLVSYNWLKEYIGDSCPTPEEIEELLTKRAFEVEEMKEVNGDVVLDIDVLPNRSSDCLSHRGIAKEVSAIFGLGLAKDPLAKKPELASTNLISVKIEDENDCPRFTASLLSGVEVKESPQWLKDRLKAVGQNSINNIVDATNYVMYATGQPLHAYDATKFPQVNGKWQFGVRKAKAGEVISLLSEGGKDGDRDVELNGTELLIVDESSNTPIGLAGVKGGRFAGIDNNSTDIIVEAAHFDAGLTRKTARGLGIVIEASRRFENEPSRELPIYAQSEIIDLIKDIAGGEFKGWVDVYPAPVEQTEVLVRTDKVNKLLGLSLSKEEMISISSLLGITVNETEDGFTAISPFERTDLKIEEDYIEEIGRVYGYEKIESVLPETTVLTKFNSRQYYGDKIRKALIEAGFNEVITSSFCKKDKLPLANALASDKSYMRSSLRNNINSVLENNISHVDLIGTQDVRVFEIGTVFDYIKDTKTITEYTSLVIGVRTKHSGHSKIDDKKLEDGIAVVKSVLGEDVDFVIENGVAETNLSLVLEKLPEPNSYDTFKKGEAITYQKISQYPAMSRDIALWVEEGQTAEQVSEIITAEAGELCVRQTLFDTFTKDGRTSYAFRLVFQASDRTLTDAEINGVMENIYLKAKDKGWEVR
ncbi:phenylalanine--tRNA ligase subunit beta [Candidatus Nomurabacteria bacterium]|nr:phenylalanine--tRNA ligase subunit beta [Candidatus Nomurabacteria bacterium]